MRVPEVIEDSGVQSPHESATLEAGIWDGRVGLCGDLFSCSPADT
jgi:hypothetical protein